MRTRLRDQLALVVDETLAGLVPDTDVVEWDVGLTVTSTPCARDPDHVHLDTMGLLYLAVWVDELGGMATTTTTFNATVVADELAEIVREAWETTVVLRMDLVLEEAGD